jgi:hypothetical protein
MRLHGSSTQRKTRTRIRNGQRFIVEPTFRLHGILIENLIRFIFIPVLGLLGIGIRNTLGIHPIFGLHVFGIVNLGGRIDRRREILEKVTTFLTFTIDQDIVCVIRAIQALEKEGRRGSKTDCTTRP